MVDRVKSGIVEFEHLGLCFYETVAFRAPLQYEYYLSGAEVKAYRAPNNLPAWRFQVVRPTHHAKAVRKYERGAAVDLTGFRS